MRLRRFCGVAVALLLGCAVGTARETDAQDPDAAGEVDLVSERSYFRPIAVHESDGRLVLDTESRITNGRDAKHGDAPHQVAIVTTNALGEKHLCGGSRIAPGLVLTAAHCVKGYEGKPERVKVISGTVEFSSGGLREAAIAVRTHPNFNVGARRNYDVAVVRAKLHESTEVIALHAVSGANLADRELLRVSGFGARKYGGVESIRLQIADVRFVPRERCTATPGINYTKARITEHMICAHGDPIPGNPHSVADACQGDSGGPLWRPGAALVGVVSFGEKCGNPGRYGVYARVESAETWIDERIAELGAAP